MSYANIIKGNITHASAILYFTKLNYNVLLPTFDHLPYDIVLEQDGVFLTVQCKFTTSFTKEHYIIKLHRGINPKELYKDVDLFFIQTPEHTILVTNQQCEYTKSRIKIHRKYANV